MKRVGQAVVMGFLMCAGLAGANPGQLHERGVSGPGDDEVVPERAVGVSEEPLRILDSAKAASCSSKAGICFHPGARTTVAVDSQPVVAAKPTVAAPPSFRRAAAVAAASKDPPRAETSLAWTLDIAAQLKRAAVAGNTLFVFFDMEDPDAIRNQQTSALFQAPVKAGRALAAHLSLSPEDGFRSGHTYRLRIVQLLGGREVILAESDLTLL